MRVSGALAARIGYALVVLARVQLGASFSVRPQARELVTSGLYSRVRNPMYVFLDLMLSGLTLLFGALWLPVIVLAFALFQTIQARREARILEQKFGQTYLDYRRKTWF